MLAENSDKLPAVETARQPIPWIRLIISLLLGGGALWLLLRDLHLAELGPTLLQASPLYVSLGVGVIVLTNLVKVWRWRLLFHPLDKSVSWRAVFHPLMLGQFLNLLIPLRIGEVARIYTFHQESGLGKARALGTLVTEKLLEIIMAAATLLLLLPLAVTPAFVADQAAWFVAVSLVGFLLLALLAYKAGPITQWLRRLAGRLPTALERRVVQLVVSGLQGLSALRRPRLVLWLLLLSAFIAVLYVVTPWLMFRAFNISLGAVEAILLHLVLMAGLAPPTTPGRVLVFEAVVAFMLRQFGLTDEALILAFAIMYHLVVILPQIVLGSIAAGVCKWKWSQLPHVST